MLAVKLKMVVSGLVCCSPGFKIVVVFDHSYTVLSSALEQTHQVLVILNDDDDDELMLNVLRCHLTY